MSRAKTTQANPSGDAVLNALKRAAKRALELGRATGTPVYVLEGNKIVDIAKRKGRRKR